MIEMRVGFMIKQNYKPKLDLKKCHEQTFRFNEVLYNLYDAQHEKCLAERHKILFSIVAALSVQISRWQHVCNQL